MSTKQNDRKKGAPPSKREQFANSGRRVSPLLVAVLAASSVLLAGFGIRWMQQEEGTRDSQEIASVSGAGGDLIRVALSELSDGQAKFFNYQTRSGKDVRFFAVKGSDGDYRAAFDTCDVCYRAKKGYFQGGQAMVCRNCGREFPTTEINEVSGGCNPVGIDGTIEGGQLVIAEATLEAGVPYF